MPLTAYQREVLRVLSARRNPESHVAGGAVLNRSEDSPRYSADVDLFHDEAVQVQAAAQADTAALAAAGFTVEWLDRQPFLLRAKVSRGGNELRLDWCLDSAFRFFPVQPDPELGYCLHWADLATNKVLALAGRSEVRDYIDILYLHANHLSLGAICWAACGKDQGYSPRFLLDQAKRNVKFREEDLAREHLARPLRLTDLKAVWLQAAEQAEAWFDKLPPADLGCLYLDRSGNPFTPDPASPDFAGVVRHFGSVRGAWPKLA
jgi:hypothetical protein